MSQAMTDLRNVQAALKTISMVAGPKLIKEVADILTRCEGADKTLVGQEAKIKENQATLDRQSRMKADYDSQERGYRTKLDAFKADIEQQKALVLRSFEEFKRGIAQQEDQLNAGIKEASDRKARAEREAEEAESHLTEVLEKGRKRFA